MSYSPTPAPQNQLLWWLQNELRRISFALEQGGQTLRLAVTAVEPDKLIEGEIRIADGVSWDPGRGAGTYILRGGKWQLIEAGTHQDSRSLAFFLGE
jgi:hypothetical protein